MVKGIWIQANIRVVGSNPCHGGKFFNPDCKKISKVPLVSNLVSNSYTILFVHLLYLIYIVPKINNKAIFILHFCLIVTMDAR